MRISSSTGVPGSAAKFLVGLIATFPATVPPAYYIALAGQLVSRITYSELWAWAQASGNLAASDGVWTSGQFSPGDGATTFRVPEYRGEFPRFLDAGRGVDVGRSIGAPQADEFRAHSHPAAVNPTPNTARPIGGGALEGATVGNGTGSAGGNETRPRNVAMLACIFTGV